MTKLSNEKDSQTELEQVDVNSLEIDEDLFRTIPIELMKTISVLPVSYRDNVLSAVVSDDEKVSDIKVLIRYISYKTNLQLYVSEKQAIDERLEDISENIETVEHILRNITGEGEYVKQTEYPNLKLVHNIIWEAIRDRASDLHFEPEEDNVRVRSRIDGVLYQKYNIPIKYWDNIARCKRFWQKRMLLIR